MHKLTVVLLGSQNKYLKLNFSIFVVTPFVYVRDLEAAQRGQDMLLDYRLSFEKKTNLSSEFLHGNTILMIMSHVIVEKPGLLYCHLIVLCLEPKPKYTSTYFRVSPLWICSRRGSNCQMSGILMKANMTHIDSSSENASREI